MAENETYLDRLVDKAALKDYLEQELSDAKSVTVQYHDEGHSNETLFIEWGNQELVMRQPPAGEIAETAHDILREYSVISSIEDTDVPVPTPVLACDDTSVIGGEFYLMERLEGDVIRDHKPERFATSEQRRRIGETLIDTLAEIHTIDYEAVGLEDLGRPEGYVERQIKRWGSSSTGRTRQRKLNRRSHTSTRSAGGSRRTSLRSTTTRSFMGTTSSTT